MERYNVEDMGRNETFERPGTCLIAGSRVVGILWRCKGPLLLSLRPKGYREPSRVAADHTAKRYIVWVGMQKCMGSVPLLALEPKCT